MKKTRIFSVILAFALCIILFTLTPSKAHAEAPSRGTIGDNLTWTLENDVTLTISGSGAMPESCASRLAPWYSQKYFIETIIIGDGITSIPEAAFEFYENLTKVVIPDTVTSIGASAFRECRKLSDITLPKNLSVIAKNTFSLCYGLTEIVIPESVTKICASAFYDCHYITSITIPSTLTHIENGAFTSCGSIQNFYISDLAAFINIDGIANLLGKNLNNKTLYLNNNPVSALVIPDGIEEIAPSAFKGFNFTSVALPNSVTKIHDSAFSCCRSLETIVIPDQVQQIGASAFSNCAKLTNVTIGNNVASIGNAAFRACPQLQKIAIPDSVTSIGTFAFADCPALSSVTIGTGLSKMNTHMFSNCSNLATIVIPGNVKSIGERAFENCTTLTSVTIGKGVTSVDKYAFSGCTELNRISFSDSVTVIGQNAFEGCSALQNIVFSKGLQVIEQSAFARCYNIVNVEFPDGLTTIGKNAFDRIQKIHIVVLPASMESIGTNAFYAVWHILFKGTENQWNSLCPNGPDFIATSGETVHFGCTGNEIKSEVVAPTCTAVGYTQYTCTICKEYCQRNLTDATGHSYSAWYVAKEATHASKGMERRDCKNCNHYESKDIPIQSHTDQNNDTICDGCGSFFCATHTEQTITGTAATCTQDGLTDGKKCSVCDTLLQAQEVIPASGHHYGDWTTTTEGSKERICELCGEKEQQAETSTPTTTPSWETIGTLPTTQSGAASSDEEVKKNPVVIVLIFLAAGAVAGGAAAVLIKKKRK